MKQLLVIITITLLAASEINAQKYSTEINPNTEPARGLSRYQLSIAPAPLAWSTLNLGIERRMTERNSLLTMCQVGFRNIHLWESLGGKYFHYGGRLEYRNYFGKYTTKRFGTLRGPYLSGWINAQRASVQATLQKEDYTVVTAQSITPGLSMGWKFALSQKLPNITLDISLGGGYRMGNVYGRYAENSRSILFKDRGISPTLGFRVGYSPGIGIDRRAPQEVNKIGREAGITIAFHDKYPRKKRKAIEKALAARHFYPGKLDGWFDEETIQAIKQFQRKNGLTSDGKVGPATLKKLGLE